MHISFSEVVSEYSQEQAKKVRNWNSKCKRENEEKRRNHDKCTLTSVKCQTLFSMALSFYSYFSTLVDIKFPLLSASLCNTISFNAAIFFLHLLRRLIVIFFTCLRMLSDSIPSLRDSNWSHLSLLSSFLFLLLLLLFLLLSTYLLIIPFQPLFPSFIMTFLLILLTLHATLFLLLFTTTAHTLIHTLHSVYP